jgi:hypothetical protein
MEALLTGHHAVNHVNTSLNYVAVSHTHFIALNQRMLFIRVCWRYMAQVTVMLKKVGVDMVMRNFSTGA